MLHTEHQRTVLKTWLTPQQRQEMRLWLLTKWNRWKSHTSVLYSWYDPDNPKKNWHNAFLAFSQTPLYKKWIWESEERFMHKYAERITKHIPQWTQQLVELWPWNDKMQTYMHFLLSYHDRLRLQYRPADVAKSALDDWLADAEKAGLRKWAPILWDWDNPVTFSQVQDAFYVCFGGWFVNSYNQLPQRISNMQWSGYIHRGRVFSTFFGMPGDDSMGEDDKVSLLKAIYGDMWTKDKPNNFGEQESYDKARDMVLQPFEALWFDTTKLDLGVERIQWDPNKIVLWARVIKSFIEKEWDEEYLYSPWDFIPLIDSPRPTVYQYTAQIQKWWGKVRDIFSDNGLVWSIVALPRKKLSKKDLKVLKTASAIAWALLLVFGGVEAWKYSENQKRQKIKNHATEEIFLGNKDLSIYQFNNTVTEILYDLEHIYGNTLSDAKKHILDWLIQDFLKKHKQNFTYYWMHAMRQIYDTGLYTPSLLQKFIVTNKQTLLSMQIQIVPFKHLIKHQEALQNSYFYDWDRLEFDDVDKEIWNYVEYTWITNINGVDQEPSYWHYWCGIKNIWWKQYFVVKTAWSESYVLQPKSHKLQSQWALCSGDIVAEIIWRGEVSVLAEKIRHFLQDKYWTEKNWSIAMNWQARIAEYLLDRYAEWWDLSFLTSDYSKDNPYRWYYEELLEKFVFSYVLPTCKSDLREYKEWNSSWDRMYAIDWEKIDKDTVLFSDYSLFVDKYYQFLCSYVPDLDSKYSPWTLKTILLKLFLVWTKDYTNHPKTKITVEETLHDPQLMRAWITKHAATFRENGIMVPVFPEWIDKFLANKGGPKYFPEDDLKHLKENEDLNANYSRSQFNDVYIDINWSSYTCWVYQKNMFAQWRFVAKMQNQRIQDALWKQYQEGKFWKIYSESDLFSSGYELKDKWEIIHRLLKIHTEYSSQNAHNLMADYAKWKQAMEKVK